MATLNDAIDFSGRKLQLRWEITLGSIEGNGSIIKRNPYLMQDDILNMVLSSFNKTSGFINELKSSISVLVVKYLLFTIISEEKDTKYALKFKYKWIN